MASSNDIYAKRSSIDVLQDQYKLVMKEPPEEFKSDDLISVLTGYAWALIMEQPKFSAYSDSSI